MLLGRKDCPIGLQRLRGGRVTCSLSGLNRRRLSFYSSLPVSRLDRVHPTWAGTFVLAALVVVFPGINFILLDSDCLPVTLFEAADLWKEGYLARFPLGTGRAMPTKHPLHRKRVYHSDPRVVYTQHRVDESSWTRCPLSH